MPQVYQQVSGGACSLTMYQESAPGKVAANARGVRLAMMSESFRRGSSKQQRSVIRGVRGPGKPYSGLPQMSGQLESAAYSPQLGYLLRALCGAPTSTADSVRTADAAAVTEVAAGIVGIPCADHGFIQDAVISVVGSTAYDGAYRVAEGTTKDVIAIAAPYVAETLTADVKIYRGRVAWLAGEAQDLGGGKVALPVDGLVHAFNGGDSVTIDGTTAYDGTFTLENETADGLLVVKTTYAAETFDGTPTATPTFHVHTFALPRRQPTVCMEKYLDFEAGAVKHAYRRFHFCKVNGLSFNLGGDEELKFTLDFTVGKEVAAAAPLDAAPLIPAAVTMDNIEGSIFLAGQRRGDIETANVTNNFGITAKAAIGDLGQYSRMPEGDPECNCAMSVFLESDDLQALVDASSTLPMTIAICSAAGDEVHFIYPETELDSEGPAITGKEGLMQDFTAMAFVNRGTEVLRVELVNRVQSYA